MFAILLDMDRRGEIGRIILEPVNIELAYYPRSEGKPYRLSIDQPVGSVGEA